MPKSSSRRVRCPPASGAAVAAAALLMTLAAPATAALLGVFADDFEHAGVCAWSTVSGEETPVRSFCARTPPISVAAGEETLVCYYFLAGNEETIGIGRFSSAVSAGVVRAMLYATRDGAGAPTQLQPAGTVSSAGCSLLLHNSAHTGFLHRADDAFASFELPADDGLGSPLAVELAAGQPLVLAMHLYNPSVSPIDAQVTVGAVALPGAVAYVRTEALLAYDAAIAIPPTSIGHPETESCSAPAGQFWWLSTLTNARAVESAIYDGASPVVVSSSWEQPAEQVHSAAPFRSFTSGAVTRTCTYDNTDGAAVNEGPALSDEQCVGIAFFFPATKPLRCQGSTGPF